MNDMMHEGDYFLQDGTPYKLESASSEAYKWYGSNPSGSGDCVFLHDGLGFWDDSCDANGPYGLCQRLRQ